MSAGGGGPAAAGSGAPPARAGGAGIRAQGEPEAEGGRLNERVERRIADIEAGRAKMKRYTLGEHLRYLDSLLDG